MPCTRELYAAQDGAPINPTRPCAVTCANAQFHRIYDAARSVNAAAGQPPPVCLAYRLGPSVNSGNPAIGTTNWLEKSNAGVAYANAVSNNWILKDSTNAYVQVGSYTEYLCDFRNAGYLAEWINTALTVVGNWDGIMMDNAFTAPNWIANDWGSAAPPARLTSVAGTAWITDMQSWTVALAAFVAQVADALHNVGKKLYVNSGPIPELQCFARLALAPYVDGMWDEKTVANYPPDVGAAYPYWWNWRTVHKQQRFLAEAGVDSICSWLLDATPAHTLFALGSYLLGASSGGSAFGAQSTYGDAGQEAYALGPAATLGEPLGRATVGSNGVWTRSFANGTVNVNPTGATVAGLATMTASIVASTPPASTPALINVKLPASARYAATNPAPTAVVGKGATG